MLLVGIMWGDKMFTLGNKLFIITWVLATIFITVPIAFEKLYYGIIHVLVSILVLLLICKCVIWYNTHTESGIRTVKESQAISNKMMEREIIITVEDDHETFYYKGKKYIIRYGNQDTIKNIEK